MGRPRARERNRIERSLIAVAAAAAGLLTAQALAGGGEWSAGRDIEAVGIEDVALEDRGDFRASGRLAGPRNAASARGERGELGALAGELYRLWRVIPAYSPVSRKSWLTSGFGWRRGPVTGKREFHGGVDLAAARGTPVVASADGMVAASFFDEGSGLVVVLDHGNGLETLYGHLDTVTVTLGQEVQRGTVVGRLGSTGWRSTGPHLHYGVRLTRRYVDPKRYLFNPAAVTAR